MRARALTLTLTLTLHPNQARAEGNELFKAGNYPAAIEKYTDAMKRDPTSALPYSNRAGCYQKLMEWQLALKDADTCVSMDPKFVKGWSRKAGATALWMERPSDDEAL